MAPPIDFIISPVAFLTGSVFVLLYYLVPYFWAFSHLRDIPGPPAALLSNFWLLIVCRAGKRYKYVDEAHKRYGPIVRIQPNHVSIADEEAIQTIYGHGTGLLKSIFTSRDRAEHSRKRKVVAHSFAPQSMRNFEPFIHSWLKVFLKKWDDIADQKAQQDGYANVEGRVWLNYLVLDIIGDLAFGAPFGVLENASEDVKVRISDNKTINLPVITSLTTRSEIAATVGTLPELRPYLKWIPDPFFHAGVTGMNNLRSLGTARIVDRLNNPPPADRHKDLLERVREGRDDKGEPFGMGELTAEALTVLIAGTDTTSSTFAALMYHVVRTPGVLQKLQAELDAALPADTMVPSFDQVKTLPYLGAIINESLRHHSSISLGLPREIPQGTQGITIKGRYYPPGTVLSIPIYTVHHLKEVWGPDAEEFRPDRWENLTPRQKKAFIPFSYGPRACLGRNLAEMELRLITAAWARRYDFVLRKDEMEVNEGLARKPIAVNVGLKRREIAV
ncbi:cytochrome P450 [Aspergillus leporis]|uniref:Cytochrome P450 n=1 Tax=Aspergillus leporis TaxID=41062 RepID=A0A5N5X0A9_9EURO|nr:cytochrome P450 [Aspergillus leporis]